LNVVEQTTDDMIASMRERARLVRLCARLTGDPDVAEDLAQETLVEAWRHMHKLHEPAARERWLAAIARNVCLRWLRRESRMPARQQWMDQDQRVADAFDPEHAWEQQELANLLDRALDCLPPATRHILVERYMHGLSYAALAAQTGLSEDAISMRLTRGKQQLRRLLAGEMARTDSLQPGDAELDVPWQQTRIWCLTCGQHRLLARLPQSSADVAFRCPGCSPDPTAINAAYPLANNGFARLIGALLRPRSILSRTAVWGHTYFRQALATRSASCTNCGRLADVQIAPAHDLTTLQHNPHLLFIACAGCGTEVSTSFRGLIHNIPEVQQFWRDHERVRMLPEYDVVIGGQPAIVSRFQSLTSVAHLDVVSQRDASHVPIVHTIGFAQRSGA
jgi:RNA polymerase sigma factor (sigma-70 family)